MEELYFGYPRRRKVSPKRRKASPKRKATKKMLDSLSLEKLKKLAKKYKVSCYKKGTKVCVKKSTLLKRLKSSRSINKILLSASKMRNEKKHRKSPKRRRRSHFGVKRKKEQRILLPANPDDAMNEVQRLLESNEVDVGDVLVHEPPGQMGATQCTIVKKNGRLECTWRDVMDYDYESEPDPESESSKTPKTSFGMKTLPPNVPNLSTPMTLSSGMTYRAMLDRYGIGSSTFLSSNMQSNGGYSAPGKSVHPPRDFRYNPRLLGTSSMPPYENISKPKSKFGQYFR